MKSLALLQVAGSPPPTRGTQNWEIGYKWGKGITPAYAGNTVNIIIKYSYSGDHPRLRGEHQEKVYKRNKKVGSPPPTRGTRYLNGDYIVPDRITPAYAGNTLRLMQLCNL